MTIYAAQPTSLYGMSGLSALSGEEVVTAKEVMLALYLLGRWPTNPTNPLEGAALAHEWGPNLRSAYAIWAAENDVDPSFRIATKEEVEGVGWAWLSYAPFKFAIIPSDSYAALFGKTEGEALAPQRAEVEFDPIFVGALVVGGLAVVGIAWLFAVKKL